jgi:hypothetical protein
MSSVGHFPVQFASLDECPDSFREPLRHALSPGEAVFDIIYSPAFVAGRLRLPASVFCVTNRQWIMVHESKSGDVHLDSAVFAYTLSIELTVILLHGRTKLDYAISNRSDSSECYFNSVMGRVYARAIQRILNFIDGIESCSSEKDRSILTDLKNWPLKFRNLGWLSLPPGGKLLGSLHWSTVLGLFRRELAPAAALFLTDRPLMIMAEEKSCAWFVKRDRTKYGAITTYCPRSRIFGFRVLEHRRFHILELKAHGAHGTAEFQVLFPPERNEEVTKLISQALPARAGSLTSVSEVRR